MEKRRKQSFFRRSSKKTKVSVVKKSNPKEDRKTKNPNFEYVTLSVDRHHPGIFGLESCLFSSEGLVTTHKSACHESLPLLPTSVDGAQTDFACACSSVAAATKDSVSRT